MSDLFRASAPVDVLEASEKDGTGRIKALVSAYDVKYRMGFATWHTLKAGAFDEALAEQENFPLFFQHNWDMGERPPIGHAAAEEGEYNGKTGLVFDASFYLDTPDGRAVYNANKAKALREWSVGYMPVSFDKDPADANHYVVTKSELWEASSVLRGANPETETMAAALHRKGVPDDEIAELLALARDLKAGKLDADKTAEDEAAAKLRAERAATLMGSHTFRNLSS